MTCWFLWYGSQDCRTGLDVTIFNWSSSSTLCSPGRCLLASHSIAEISQDNNVTRNNVTAAWHSWHTISEDKVVHNVIVKFPSIKWWAGGWGVSWLFVFQTERERAAAPERPHHRQQGDQQAEDEHQAGHGPWREGQGQPPPADLRLPRGPEPEVAPRPRHWERQTALTQWEWRPVIQTGRYQILCSRCLYQFYFCIIFVSSLCGKLISSDSEA